MTEPVHFKGKEALSHVVEAEAKGFIEAAEVHGIEMPGHLSALAESAKETAVLLLLLLPFTIQWTMLLPLFFGWTLWKFGRSTSLGYSRLERLHRMVAEEKWEIDHHREQEREELTALYAAKGFKGKLLEEVIDVLMADGDRLLRVMVEEELGLRLESQEHPLKQGLGAAFGCLLAVLCTLPLVAFGSNQIAAFAALLVVAVAAGYSAYYNRNRKIAAIVWTIGLTILASASCYFLWDFVRSL